MPASARRSTAAGFPFASGPRTRAFSALDDNTPPALIAMFGDRGMGQDLLDEVARAPADLVVVDCLLFGAMDAARRAGLRYVVLEHLYDALLPPRLAPRADGPGDAPEAAAAARGRWRAPS